MREQFQIRHPSGHVVDLEIEAETRAPVPGGRPRTFVRVNRTLGDGDVVQIASAEFIHMSDGLYPEHVNVDPSWRRVGLASRIYALAERSGLRVVPSDNQTSEGRAFSAKYRGLRPNPQPEIPEAAREAAAKYEEFHRYGPTQIEVGPSSFHIPDRVYLAGPALAVMYRSRKVDPETLRRPREPVNYIHEHDAGVQCFLINEEDTDGEEAMVPESFRRVPALTRLGHCLGFAFRGEDGEECDVESRAPLPELYATPDGKCLLVVQGRRQILAMMWGGALGVFARGIDG